MEEDKHDDSEIEKEEVEKPKAKPKTRVKKPRSDAQMEAFKKMQDKRKKLL